MDVTPRPRMRKMKSNLISVIIILPLFFGFFFFIESKVTFNEDSFKVSCPLAANETVLYSEVASVTLKDASNLGERKVGFNIKKIASGTYTSSVYGEYTRSTYEESEAVIVVWKTDGKYLIFSGKTTEATQELWTTLCAKLPETAVINNNL
jgi:hypothetical protein